LVLIVGVDWKIAAGGRQQFLKDITVVDRIPTSAYIIGPLIALGALWLAASQLASLFVG